MALFVYPPVSLSISGNATEAKQDDIITELVDINTELDSAATEATLATRASEATLATRASEATAAIIAGDTTSLDAKAPALGAAVTAASSPVNIASDQVVAVSASALPLPAGAATEATLASVDGKDFSTETTQATRASEATLATVAGDTTSLDAKVPAQGAAAIVASTPVNIASDQVVPVSASTLPLPSGASTSALQTSGNASLTTIAAWDTNAGAVSATTQRVQLTTESLAALENITAVITPNAVFTSTYTDASSSNIPGNATAPLQLIALTGSDINEIQAFDTTGTFMEIMTGAAASEVRLCLVGPGNDQPIKVAVTSGTRLSVRRVDSATAATLGSLAINYLG